MSMRAPSTRMIEGVLEGSGLQGVAYWLERVKELTGLDPQISDDRERLGLGIEAYRILAPVLQR